MEAHGVREFMVVFTTGTMARYLAAFETGRGVILRIAVRGSLPVA